MEGRSFKSFPEQVQDTHPFKKSLEYLRLRLYIDFHSFCILFYSLTQSLPLTPTFTPIHTWPLNLELHPKVQ